MNKKSAHALPADVTPLPEAVMFPLARIRPMKDQPRSEIDNKKVRQYAADIARKKQLGRGVGGSGILQPILVRWDDTTLNPDGTPNAKSCVIITAGETRYRSAIKAGLQFMPVNIVAENSEEAYEDSLAENLLRDDISPEDEGRALLYLKNKDGLSVRQLAERIYGDQKRYSYVQQRISALKLSADVQEGVDQTALSVSAMRRIQAVQDPDERRRLIAFMRGGGVIRDLENEIRAIRKKEEEADERRKESQRSPDSETARRQRAVASGRTGSMSRGKLLTGSSPREAQREAKTAIKNINGGALHLRRWWPHLTPVQKKMSRAEWEGLCRMMNAALSDEKQTEK